MSKHAVVIISGGLDSTTLLYYIKDRELEPHVLSFDYGQRHSKELQYAARTCAELEVDHEIVDLTVLQPLLKSSLTFEGEVPHGHYAEVSMKQTIVPNRNAIMLSIAYGWAVSLGATDLFCGAHSGDHAIYPDCREEFFKQLEATLQFGNSWSPAVQIITPFLFLSKRDIVDLGVYYHVPFEQTWSCYEGGLLHCGRCGTCVERREAFHLAGVQDPTTYADEAYWKEITHA